MQISKEMVRGSKDVEEHAPWISCLTTSPTVARFPYSEVVRISYRHVEGIPCYFFEDNVRMLRIVITEKGDEIIMAFFGMEAPDKMRPARPAWVERKPMRGFMFKKDAVASIQNAFLSFFTNSPTIYPLEDKLRIALTDDLKAIERQTYKPGDFPTYFCGRVTHIETSADRNASVAVQAKYNGELIDYPIELVKGKYYGNPPARGDFVIAKQGHLTAVVRERELKRYFAYKPS